MGAPRRRRAARGEEATPLRTQKEPLVRDPGDTETDPPQTLRAEERAVARPDAEAPQVVPPTSRSLTLRWLSAPGCRATLALGLHCSIAWPFLTCAADPSTTARARFKPPRGGGARQVSRVPTLPHAPICVRAWFLTGARRSARSPSRGPPSQPRQCSPARARTPTSARSAACRRLVLFQHSRRQVYYPAPQQ